MAEAIGPIHELARTVHGLGHYLYSREYKRELFVARPQWSGNGYVRETFPLESGAKGALMQLGYNAASTGGVLAWGYRVGRSTANGDGLVARMVRANSPRADYEKTVLVADHPYLVPVTCADRTHGYVIESDPTVDAAAADRRSIVFEPDEPARQQLINLGHPPGMVIKTGYIVPSELMLPEHINRRRSAIAGEAILTLSLMFNKQTPSPHQDLMWKWMPGLIELAKADVIRLAVFTAMNSGLGNSVLGLFGKNNLPIRGKTADNEWRGAVGWGDDRFTAAEKMVEFGALTDFLVAMASEKTPWAAGMLMANGFFAIPKKSKGNEDLVAERKWAISGGEVANLPEFVKRMQGEPRLRQSCLAMMDRTFEEIDTNGSQTTVQYVLQDERFK